MSLFFPDEGELFLLAQTLTDDSNFQMRVFTNDHTPANGDVISDYTEATFAGYAAVNLARDGTMAIDGDGYARQEYDEILFTLDTFSTSTTDVYGIFIVDTSSSKLVAAERVPSPPLTLDVNTPSLRSKPRLRLHGA